MADETNPNSQADRSPWPDPSVLRSTPPRIHNVALSRADLHGQARYALTRYRKLSWRTQFGLLVLLLCSVLPLFVLLDTTSHVYTLYTRAHSAILHITATQRLFTDNHGRSSGDLDPTKLQQAHTQLQAAHNDLVALQAEIQQDDPFMRSGAYLLPQQLASIRALCTIGIAATEIGISLTSSAQVIAPVLHSALLTSTTPLVTPVTLRLIQATITYIQPRLRTIEARSRNLSLANLPLLNANQQHFLREGLQLVPQARAILDQGDSLLAAIGWILGVDAPRTFLVQTLDRAELRPAGGFTGQFSNLTLNGGRISPLALQDIGPYEESGTLLPTVAGQHPPAPYDSWWPLPDWGMRDANLSADFPTTARLTSDAYAREFNTQVDGVIVFSPSLISRIIAVTGPIAVPAYHETITAQNLEQRLHYYQLDNQGIRTEELIEHEDDPLKARKLFTRHLSNLLVEQIRHVQPARLLTIGMELLNDLKTKDLQVYFTDQQAEELIGTYGSLNQIDTSLNHDGLFIVQANISANKASPYVKTDVQDTITLDSAGGATHVMKLRLAYTQVGSVYGLDTYRNYLRIYVPDNAQLLWANGFDQGTAQPLCGGSNGHCPDDAYHDGTLLCPPGLTNAGYATNMQDDHYHHQIHPINMVGGPTNTASDISGRSMYGGWVIVPKDCNLTLGISWYVPSMGHQPYSLLFQRQANTLPELDLTILPATNHCNTQPGLYFHGVLAGPDRAFALSQIPATHRQIYHCLPQPALRDNSETPLGPG